MISMEMEMLLLDYELSMLREDEQRRVYLGSTHWPWIGERTRQVDGAHVALLAEVLNPVACKVGPEIGRDQLLALCERLDPRREPGRLTLIARMGAQKVGERLPPLVEAVRAAGHPVIWLSDPMHGNTIVAPCGNKTRLVRSIAEEVAAFRLAVSGSGGVAAGLHRFLFVDGIEINPYRINFLFYRTVARTVRVQGLHFLFMCNFQTPEFCFILTFENRRAACPHAHAAL
ncbi:phenazine biosynthesis protein PhzC [Pseudomonas aeruginosa PA38182]|nr:phenazine biosynthesis protein PhzC [Pseudomonas aeruginosa PA38182]